MCHYFGGDAPHSEAPQARSGMGGHDDGRCTHLTGPIRDLFAGMGCMEDLELDTGLAD